MKPTHFPFQRWRLRISQLSYSTESRKDRRRKCETTPSQPALHFTANGKKAPRGDVYSEQTNNSTSFLLEAHYGYIKYDWIFLRHGECWLSTFKQLDRTVSSTQRSSLEPLASTQVRRLGRVTNDHFRNFALSLLSQRNNDAKLP